MSISVRMETVGLFAEGRIDPTGTELLVGFRFDYPLGAIQ